MEVVQTRQFAAWVAFFLVLVVAGVLRWPDVDAGVGTGDEATVVERAVLALDGRIAPPAWDWPPASSYLVAAAVLAGRVVGFDAAADPARLYTVARFLFAAVAVSVVAVTGLLGVRLADDGRRAPWTAVGAALALALSFVSVRLSRAAHPEHLQLLCMLLALLATLRFDRGRRVRWLVAAGLAAGAAGAVKYLGATVVVVPLAGVLTLPGLRMERRLGGGVLLGLSTVAGFVAGTLGTSVRGTAFPRGFVEQWRHQAGGHLGYEGGGWAFHLGQALPGTWGWPLTVAAAAGVALVLLRGSRAQRLVAGYTVVLCALVGASRIAFPHYMLIATPLLAVFALVAAGRLVAAVPRGRPWFAAGLAAAALVPTALHDARLLRIAAAPTTTAVAAALAADLPGPVWSDHSTGVRAPSRSEFSLAPHAAEVLRCDCFAVLSSLQEDRYRRLESRYREEVAGYDTIRRAGRTVAVVEPSLPLSYRWDLLPEWGIGTIPLRGPLPTVGPSVTILDLRATPG